MRCAGAPEAPDQMKHHHGWLRLCPTPASGGLHNKESAPSASLHYGVHFLVLAGGGGAGRTIAPFFHAPLYGSCCGVFYPRAASAAGEGSQGDADLFASRRAASSSFCSCSFCYPLSPDVHFLLR
ncbi:hypothetical protein ZHAS_00021146 [Anopheles sinensis]|uniref:Uncharacterized protein n=1 Tax=Anopheles sinensis TaxID=74873 RepID=A0A084WRM8_ANOSI|nr:hypothetical protein ZHAS_00021146 [Anopheles sinensis]